MTSPLGADDHLGALSNDERSRLAAWADDGDVPDGFEDRVVAAFLSGAGTSAAPGERSDGADPFVGVGRLDRGRLEADALATGPRAAVREGRVLRFVGLCAAVAAAAAVMLMVRVLPRAEVEPERGVAAAERAVPADPVVRVEPGAAAVELEGEGDCETDVLEAEATLVAAQHCSPCHDSAARDSVPGAVDVFDVQQQEWWSLMSETQIDGARRRVQALEASEEDRRKLDAFLARRLAPPPHAG